MKIKIKRFDTSLPLPQYKSKGAACADLVARLDVTIEPQAVGYIPLNVAIEIPEGYWAQLAVRSSTHKLGLIPANGIGILDSDYRGDNDEYILIVYNYRQEPVTVTRGLRIAQLMVLPLEQMEFEEVEVLQAEDRGGIGSTGFH